MNLNRLGFNSRADSATKYSVCGIVAVLYADAPCTAYGYPSVKCSTRCTAFIDPKTALKRGANRFNARAGYWREDCVLAGGGLDSATDIVCILTATNDPCQ